MSFLGLRTLLHAAGEEARYDELAAQATLGLPADGEDSVSDEGVMVDWSQLGRAVAWVRLEGTNIDYPVAQAFSDESDFYLTHDVWGERSYIGCPFVDSRTSPSSVHCMVLAHRVPATGGGFTPLTSCHRQTEFDALGTLVWVTREADETSRTTLFKPAFALEVDMADQHVQSFDFESKEELRDWLSEGLRRTSARDEHVETMVAGASKAMSLVTCSSEQHGQRTRTVVVFVA